MQNLRKQLIAALPHFTVLVLFALIGVSVYQGYEKLKFSIDINSSVAATPKTEPQAAVSPIPIYLRDITRRNLFGELETNHSVLQETTADLKLVGLFSVIKGESLALIRSQDTEEEAYSLGEFLPTGHEVKNIRDDHIILSLQGSLSKLSLSQKFHSLDQEMLPSLADNNAIGSINEPLLDSNTFAASPEGSTVILDGEKEN